VRAATLLASLAGIDALLVAIAGAAPSQYSTLQALRAQLLGIVAMAAAGIVALAALSLAMRIARRHRLPMVRAASSLACGLALAVVPAALAAWTWLWVTPGTFPVAVVCGASAVLLLWQGIEGLATPPAAFERAG
jgi:Na+-translocating ferredoxin:NAD+ oxidoreductase RnfD subunit